MDEQNSPPAQEQPAGAGSAAAVQEPSGVEKRINEMHAKLEAESQARQHAEQAVLAMTGQIAELTQAVMQQRVAPAPVAPEPEVEVDPEDARRIASVAKRMYGTKLDSIEQTLKAMNANFAQMRGETVEQKYAWVDPTILAEAKKKAASGFGTLEACIKYVRGEKAFEADIAAAQAARGKDRMAIHGTHTIPFQAGAPNSTGVDGAIPELPANFDQLKTSERIKILKKRGVENKPI